MIQGMIADIQRCSIHDGPGLRTTVFFKGCPLHCAWCHNPESISIEPQTLFYPERCIGCGMCDQGCFAGARVLCGKELDVDAVMREVAQDQPYYGADGGITLSGGEPMMQPDFAEAILDACHEKGVHTALESSLFAPWETVERLLKKSDLLMTDLKIWSDDLHKQYTNQSNKRILENMEHLDTLNIPIIMRTPVIPEINGTTAEIGAIASFAAQRKNLLYYELLPYHPLGMSKANALGPDVQKEYTKPSAELMRELAREAEKHLPGRVRIAGVAAS